MAADTSQLLLAMLKEFDLSFYYRSSVRAHLFERRSVRPNREYLRAEAVPVLDRQQATDIEPVLAHCANRIERVVYSADDAAGRPDTHRATLVAGLKRNYELQTSFGHEVGSRECN